MIECHEKSENSEISKHFIISKNLERMGLHVPKFKTVKVNFNGYDWGVMLIEEHFTKEFF